MSDSAEWIRRFVKCDLTIEQRDKLLAIADELEAAQRDATQIIYKCCDFHIGSSWIMRTKPLPQPVVVCPICFPPDRILKP